MTQCYGMGTRGIICRTAVRVFAEKGYDAASMDQIALEAGVAKGTVYYHFKSKSNLFSAIIENGLDALIEDVEGATLRSTDPVEQLSAIFDALIDYAQTFDDFMYLLFKEALAPGREWASDVVVYWNRFVDIIEDVVARGKSMGRIDNVDTDAITQSIVSSLATAALGWATGIGDEMWAERVLHGVKGITLRGIVVA
ncbi:MAG: TetR/AcrR family transcriptional regulator [Bacillota bacterium]